MNLYEALEMLGDGHFDVPVKRELHLGEQVLLTGGVLRGTINSGVIEFEKPYPKAKVGLCVAVISSVEPSAPDAAIVSATAPWPIGKQRRRIRIEETDE